MWERREKWLKKIPRLQSGSDNITNSGGRRGGIRERMAGYVCEYRIFVSFEKGRKPRKNDGAFERVRKKRYEIDHCG